MRRAAFVLMVSVFSGAAYSGSVSAANAACGLPMGTATVSIADPSLPTLNVRESPGGKVRAQIPEGSEVTVIGECGPQGGAGGAGIAAGAGELTPAPAGWCQINAPLTGCVMEQFLVPSGAAPPGGAGGAGGAGAAGGSGG